MTPCNYSICQSTNMIIHTFGLMAIFYHNPVFFDFIFKEVSELLDWIMIYYHRRLLHRLGCMCNTRGSDR